MTEKQSLLYEQESYLLRGLWIEIHKYLGPGHTEITYGNAFEKFLKEKNIPYAREPHFPLSFNGQKVGNYRPDFVVFGKIIVEFKSLQYIPDVFIKKLDRYLAVSDYKLGFIVNFGASKTQIVRRIHDKLKSAQQSPRFSASSAVGQKGQLALLSLLIIGAITLAAALSASFIGRTELTKGFRHSLQEEAQSLADSCLEEGLYRVKSDANYEGGVFTMGDGICSITVVDDSATTKIITVQAKVQSLVRKAEAKVQTNPFKILSRTEKVTDAFHQTDWAGGASADIAAHLNGNQIGWTKFSNDTADADKFDISNGEIKMAYQYNNWTQTNDTTTSYGFNFTGNGDPAVGKALSSTVVSGIDNGASVNLSPGTAPYTASGTYTSGVLNTGQKSDFITASWTAATTGADTFTHTNDGDFNGTNNTNTTVSGGSVKLLASAFKISGGNGTTTLDLSLGSAIGGCDVANQPTVFTSWSASTCTISTATNGGIFEFTSINIPATNTLKVTGANKLTLKSKGVVAIAGTIDLNGVNTESACTSAPNNGGGGQGGSYWTAGTGVGPGGIGGGSTYGSGGGFGNIGGDGDTTNASYNGGSQYGMDNSSDVFYGGSGGGGGGGGSSCGNAWGSSGGSGAGAIRVVSEQTITVASTGTIIAVGGNGNSTCCTSTNYRNAGGGGAGAGVLLQANDGITNNGTIDVRGGTGGNGSNSTRWRGAGGAGGRIRMETWNGNNIVSGAMGTNIIYTGGAAGTVGFNSATAGGGGTYSGGIFTAPNNSEATLPVYYLSGTYTSLPKEVGSGTKFGTISWTQCGGAACPAGTIIVMKVRSCDDANCTGETDWATVSSSGTDISGLNCAGGGVCVTDGHGWVKYQATLNASADLTQTPTLDSVTINTVPLVLRVRAGNDSTPGDGTGGWTSDSSDCGNWTEIGSGATPASPVSLGTTFDGNQWIQYCAKFYTVNTAYSPILDDITIKYRHYPVGEYSLISSPFDSGDATNAIKKIQWVKTTKTSDWTQTDDSLTQTGFNFIGNGSPPIGSTTTATNTKVSGTGDWASVKLSLFNDNTFDDGTGANGIFDDMSSEPAGLTGYLNAGSSGPGGVCPATFDAVSIDYCFDTSAAGITTGIENGVTAAIYNFISVNLTKNVRVIGSRPLVIKSQEDIAIAGNLSLKGGPGSTGITNGPGGTGVAGGKNGGGARASYQSGYGGQGPISNGSDGTSASGGNGGSGGGGGAGGNGTTVCDASGGGGNYGEGATGGTALNGRAGNTYGSGDLSILYGGSGGGGGCGGTNIFSSGGGGGAGGGAVKISTNGSLTVSGSISANGGAGAEAGLKDGGGGSGGSIFLQGNAFNISGPVTAIGGSGTTYVGGNGRIRLDYASIAGAANVNPPAGYTVCPSGCSAALTIPLSGTYTSGVLNTGQKSDFTTASWTASIANADRFTDTINADFIGTKAGTAVSNDSVILSYPDPAGGATASVGYCVNLSDNPKCTNTTATSISGGTYNYANFYIGPNRTITVIGTSALIINANGDVIIDGTLQANGGDGGPDHTAGAAGAGGGAGGRGSSDSESTCAFVPATAGTGNSGSGGGGAGSGTGNGGAGGGGGFGAIGGAGTGDVGGAGGIINGSISNGGAGGGGGGESSGECANYSGGGGGGGGGRIHITTDKTVTIGAAGYIKANGGLGNSPYIGGGGGSGGSIRLEAFNILNNGSSDAVNAAIQANGGAGGNGWYNGGGGGGGGRILLIDSDGIISGGGGASRAGGSGGLKQYGGQNGNSGGSTTGGYTQVSSPYYYLSLGTYTSLPKAVGVGINFGTISWTQCGGAACPAGTSIVMKVRSCDDANCTGETDWATVSSSGTDISGLNCAGGGVCVTDGRGWVQYQATLYANPALTQTPTLDDVTITAIITPLILEMRAGNTPAPDASWTDGGNWTNAEIGSGATQSGINLDAFDGNQYIQYRAKFSTANVSYSPSLDDITINYYHKLDTDIQFQIRTSPNNSTWTSWCGPTACDDIAKYADPYGTEAIFSTLADLSGDRFFQYKAIFQNDDPAGTPILKNAHISYELADKR